MTRKSYPFLRCVVEGIVDQEIVKILAKEASFLPPQFIGSTNGKGDILKNIANYNRSADQIPWLVLVDLDNEKCAPLLMKKHLPYPAKKMCFRIAVREVEAWLLADAERFASFFKVSKDKITNNADSLLNPKREIVRLIEHSTDSMTRKLMLPRLGSGREVGPGYTDKLVEFVTGSSYAWQIRVATKYSPSLRRSLLALKKLRKIA